MSWLLLLLLLLELSQLHNSNKNNEKPTLQSVSQSVYFTSGSVNLGLKWLEATVRTWGGPHSQGVLGAPVVLIGLDNR